MLISQIIRPDGGLAVARASYVAGQLRDEDLLLDPALLPLRNAKPVSDLLRIRRDF